MRRSSIRSAGAAVPAIVLLVLASGCASGGARVPAGVAAADAPFLLPPAEGWQGSLTPDQASWLDDLHDDLLAGSDPATVLGETTGRIARFPDFDPARVLDAQARFLDGQYTGVLELLAPVRERNPGFVAAEVISGRAAERAGRPTEAFEAYWSARLAAAPAAARVEAMRDGVLDDLSSRLEEELATGRVDDATGTVARMELWAPDDERTLAATQSLAEASGDPMAMLARLRGLTDRPEADPELVRRRVELELEVGDPAAAVRLAEELAAADPTDPGLAELLQRSRFTWRLNVLPPEVRRLARAGELTRADYAVLLYWLFPSVRYGRGTEARIATDIIDHDERERIVRVINLGLLDVDAVHRFDPDAPITSGDALRALLRLIEDSELGETCIDRGTGGSLAAMNLCSAAEGCGLLGASESCSPGSRLSGPEALESIRRALAGLDSNS